MATRLVTRAVVLLALLLFALPPIPLRMMAGIVLLVVGAHLWLIELSLQLMTLKVRPIESGIIAGTIIWGIHPAFHALWVLRCLSVGVGMATLEALLVIVDLKGPQSLH